MIRSEKVIIDQLTLSNVSRYACHREYVKITKSIRMTEFAGKETRWKTWARYENRCQDDPANFLCKSIRLVPRSFVTRFAVLEIYICTEPMPHLRGRSHAHNDPEVGSNSASLRDRYQVLSCGFVVSRNHQGFLSAMIEIDGRDGELECPSDENSNSSGHSGIFLNEEEPKTCPAQGKIECSQVSILRNDFRVRWKNKSMKFVAQNSWCIK